MAHLKKKKKKKLRVGIEEITLLLYFIDLSVWPNVGFESNPNFPQKLSKSIQSTFCL